MLEVLKNYGIDNYQYNSLMAIKDQKYADKNKFIDDVVRYGKLKKSQWSEENIPNLGIGKEAMNFLSQTGGEENLLKDEDVTAIIETLAKTYEEYIGIQ
jgi:hypothetical protein